MAVFDAKANIVPYVKPTQTFGPGRRSGGPQRPRLVAGLSGWNVPASLTFSLSQSPSYSGMLKGMQPGLPHLDNVVISPDATSDCI